MPATATRKQTILENAGYAYSFERMIYVNRDARKAFSVEFIDDHSEGELEDRINEPTPQTGEWHFYFNSGPSDAVKRELSALLA